MVVRLSSVLKSKNRKDTDQSLKNLCPKAVWIRVLIFVGIDAGSPAAACSDLGVQNELEQGNRLKPI